MDKALRDYTHHMDLKLKEWQKLSVDERKPLAKEVRQTYRHHLAKVHDFQHERLIHLLITLFFGLLFLFSIVASFSTEAFALTDAAILSSILALILLITELFYVRHYYVLENGVQNLYKMTDRFIVLMSD